MLYTVISLADIFAEPPDLPEAPSTPPRSTDPFSYLTFTKPQRIALSHPLDIIRREIV